MRPSVKLKVSMYMRYRRFLYRPEEQVLSLLHFLSQVCMPRHQWDTGQQGTHLYLTKTYTMKN